MQQNNASTPLSMGEGLGVRPKIQMTTPLVEMDGYEMTRILWKVRSVLTVFILMFVFGSLLSCSDDNDVWEEVSMPGGIVVPVELVDEEELPAFIITLADQYPTSHTKLYVFSGFWEGKVLYLLHHSLMSSFYYHLYDSDGNRLEYGDNTEVVKQAKNWKCIYIKH